MRGTRAILLRGPGRGRLPTQAWPPLNRRNRRAALAAGGVAAAVVLLLALGALLFGGAKPARSLAVPSSSARIVRTDVVERQQVSGTLDYRGSFAVADAGPGGVVTWLPSGGTIVRRGGALFELDRRPVPLLYGGRPAYRDFKLGMSDGADLRELQQNLLALGFSARGTLAVSGRFDLATLVAVEAWQRSLGLEPTGTLPLGSVVFLPGAARVSSTATAAGATVQPGAAILSATAPAPAVLIPLDPGSVAQLRTGDRVLVTLPDGRTTPGRVASIGRVATTPSSNSGQGPATPTILVTVSLLHAHTTGGLDQAPVQVAITTHADRKVLAVPISALLAQPGGGYAVQIESGKATRLVVVTTGLFDDVAGRVEISGAGLAAGQRVEVPSR
jgi:peptidoglycan hydrolase-like protein with peptidoglycan-binding domain